MDASTSMHWKDLLRHERILRNWRQQDLADQLETTVATIKRWERGNQRPSAYFRVKLCALFGKNPQELGLVEAISPSSPIIHEEISEREQATSSLGEPPGLWTVPYLRNPHFTGREDLLDRLAQHLFKEPGDASRTRKAALSQPQAIKGLGGIGKTQIAVEYAYRARLQEHYTHTLWINAASSEAILTSFQTLAEQLPNFAARDEKDQHKLIAAILRWLEECPEPWLLIIDNADELTLIQPYLPREGHGSILLTTRATAVSWLATTIEVEPMGLIEGTQFLLHRAGWLSASDEEWNEASNIVIALDGFPLALDQAGAYIEETGCSFGDYHQLYEQRRTILLARRGKQATNYPDSVATTWSLSFQKIEQARPAAAELLRLCAYLSPDHIPEELLTQGAAHWPPLLQEAVTDPLCFNELLEALLAFSLVKRFVQERLLSVHQLVQAVQLDRMDLEEQHLWAKRVVCAVNTLFPADPKNEVDIWPQCLRYLEQVQACDALIQQYCLQVPEAAELLDRVGVYLREHASYSLAEPLFKRALAITEQQVGYEGLQVASLLANLGLLYHRQRQYDQAKPLLLRALRIQEETLGPQHPQVAGSLNTLGLLYSKQGQWEQAESCHQRALRIREETLGPQHPRVAASLSNLGLIYWSQGLYDQAEPFFQRAFHIREDALGPGHPQMATALSTLSILYAKREKYDQAIPLLQRALLIWEQALGPQHPEVASSLSNLGYFYTQQGQYDQASPLLQRALLIWEQALGPQHPDAAFALSNLGLLSYQQGQYDQASPLLQRALLIWEQALGPQHLQIADPLHRLANLSREQGQYEQAEALYQRALAIRHEYLDPHHPDIADILQDLAQLREIQQQSTEALSLYQQALAIREHTLGGHHPKTLSCRARLHAMLQALGKAQEAADPGGN